MKKQLVVLLPVFDLPEDVAIGHLAEMSDLISHDEALADSFRNDLCRNHLRLAEAWAAGYQAGQKASKGDDQ